MTTTLGSGAFGIVIKGIAEGIHRRGNEITTVAVKTIKDAEDQEARQDLMEELNLMLLIPKHPNVVRLLGCCTLCQPICVIVEYCENGDLQGFLRNSRGIYEEYYKATYGGSSMNLTSKRLLTFAWQIAKGMNHLSSMRVCR